MSEIWKDIKGYEGLYQVSDLGRVRGLDRYVRHNYGGDKFVKGMYMKLSKANNGYYGLSLCKKRLSIHRLVAIAFIDNPENKEHVNHIDGDKSNNIVSNLEWATPSENQTHAFRNDLRSSKGIKHPQSKLTDRQVLEIRQLYDKGIEHKLISEQYNITKSYVSTIGRRIAWKHI